jgi:hypothetical protein
MAMYDMSYLDPTSESRKCLNTVGFGMKDTVDDKNDALSTRKY